MPELYRFAVRCTGATERARFFTLDTEGAVLVVNDQGGLTIIHSITNLGGTFALPKNKLICLQGLANSARGSSPKSAKFSNGMYGH
jgi:hypothetical protein